jgi:hypothetical protein
MRSYSYLQFSLVLSIFLTIATIAQTSTFTEESRKEITAIKFNRYEFKFDGHLDDSIWRNAIFVSDFLQKEPTEGGRPVDSTKIAVMYDEDALYIGAHMYCQNPQALRMHLDKHDVQGPAEQLIVCLDTYLDRRTAYVFGVNTAGVRFDRFHYEDSEGSRDFSYNPIWEAKTAVDNSGWTAEMRIPFSQLRFNKADKQTWGINFNRWIPSRNEDVFWIYTPRNESGYASRFGNLNGIESVKPTRRLELLPYAASDQQLYDNPQPGNPFNDGSDFGYRIGSDLKMGLGPNLTLDATINPDFGQVEADPAEVNLTAYETFYEEKRPFFTEGSHLFSGSGPTYFYSRRIGSSPRGGAPGDYVDRPTNTSILSASKITGRLSSGLSIGALGAVTEREYAKSVDTAANSEFKTEIEPVTIWGVTRVQQEFGKDHSTAGITLTGVKRDLDDGDPLAGSLHKQAITGGGNWNIRLKDGMYRIDGHLGFSHVSGTEEAILRTQNKSAHYFQRPDQDHVTLDSNCTSLTGFTNSIEFRKATGKHWLWGIGTWNESPDFELNDAGILGTADDIEAYGWLAYRETNPGKVFRNYYFEYSASGLWNYGGVRTGSFTSVYGETTWKNYLNTWMSLNFQLGFQSDDRTRGGPLMWFERGWDFNAGFSTNFAANTKYSGSVIYARDELGGWLYRLNSTISSRIGRKWEFSVTPIYQREEQPRQYVQLSDQSGGPAETYGMRYAFSRIDASTLRLQLRMNYYFTPNLSLEVYAEPFSASGDYFDHGELTAARTTNIRLYPAPVKDTATGYLQVTDGADTFYILDDDYGVRSFRSNVVLRWMFQPGSTLYLVWQRNLEEDREPGRMVNFGSLFDTFGAEGSDFLALKIAYWIPVS